MPEAQKRPAGAVDMTATELMAVATDPDAYDKIVADMAGGHPAPWPVPAPPPFSSRSGAAGAAQLHKIAVKDCHPGTAVWLGFLFPWPALRRPSLCIPTWTGRRALMDGNGCWNGR